MHTFRNHFHRLSSDILANLIFYSVDNRLPINYIKERFLTMIFNKVLEVISGRIFTIALAIGTQIILITAIMVFLTSQAALVLVAMQLVNLGVVLYILSSSDNPSFKISWIVFVLMVTVGGVVYLLWAKQSIPRKVKLRYEKHTFKEYSNIYGEKSAIADLETSDPNLHTQARYIEKMSAYPVYTGTACDFFPLGEDMFAAMLDEISKAKRFILMEYFILQPGVMLDGIVDALKERIANGVDVYLMYDDVGCLQTLPKKYDEYLRSLGIKVTEFNPFTPRLNASVNYRDHRKICVIDGNVGFCGGANLADEYINHYDKHGHWKDTAVLLRGDAVWSLTSMFVTLWNISNEGKELDYATFVPTQSQPSDGYIQPYSDSPIDDINIARDLYLQMINRANNYFYATTPYLIIDNEMITSLCLAARSGVDVRIITPYQGDKGFVHLTTRGFYPTLVKSGVKIYEYRPGFIHAKQVVSDDNIAIVGTTNFDFRSFYHHFECGVVFYNSSMVDSVKSDIVDTLSKCVQITHEDIEKRSGWTKFLIAVSKLFSPLM